MPYTREELVMSDLWLFLRGIKLRELKAIDREAIEDFVIFLQDLGFDIYDCDGNPAVVEEVINEYFRREYVRETIQCLV